MANTNPFQEAVKRLVRQELKNYMGFNLNTMEDDEETPIRRRRRRRRVQMRATPKRRRRRASRPGQGAVTNPKTDKRLKKNRAEEE
jgi:hypothetical protein